MACNILIVDDSRTTRAMIKRVIQLAGVATEGLYEAGNGKEALEILSKMPVDLVLADLHMPEMNGIELTQEIQKNPATSPIPIVIISAEPSQEKIAALQGTGIRGHLRKPFSPEALRDMVNSLLGVPNA